MTNIDWIIDKPGATSKGRARRNYAYLGIRATSSAMELKMTNSITYDDVQHPTR